ncbi:hypothetical protein [Kribbella sp. NPDC048915]|uniref:hypothetical protein n=1 Tax=Kribbella sp. NPDC048915 TaxID=3155148 RepID=UPI0033DA6738
MRIRRATIVPAVTVAVLLAGCSGPSGEAAPSTSPSESPSASPSVGTPSVPTPSAAKVADTVCVRMDPDLVQATLGTPVANIQPKNPPAEVGLPTYDVCQFTLAAGANGPVLRVGVSVLPATPATLAASRKADLSRQREPIVPVALGQGGYGTSTSLVFLLDGRLYKLTGPQATPAKYVVLGREVTRQVAGLPEPELMVTREECDRGSAVAEKVMGAPAVVRRDGETLAGDPVCAWITASSVLSASARREADAAKLLAPIRKLPTSQSIPLGDEAYVDTGTGRTTIRIGEDKLVDLVPEPARAVDPDLMTQFALAMIPLYR